MTLTVTDLFAGAGGSSTGAVSVPGVAVKYAANHWQRAVDVHNANHPDTDHICADISQYNPRRLRPTDILWASPECTNHSVAKGVRRRDWNQLDLFGEILPDEAAERSRATMWDVPRFAEAHSYRSVIVENVVDAARWAPFEAWLSAMHSLGYRHRIVYLNSMHAQAGGLPAPQSRDRMYVVFSRRGETAPDLDAMQRPTAWCPTCQADVRAIQSWKRPDRPWGRYRAQYVYRCPSVTCRNQVVEPYWLPASSAIDWTLPGQRIGDRSKPLADKTRARIAAGIERYWRPFTLEAAGNTFERRPGVRTWPTDGVLTTLHTTMSKALAVPVEGRDGKDARPVGDPLRTQTTRLETGLAWAEPFIAELRGGGSVARQISHPMATVTAAGNHHGLVCPSGGTWTEEARPTSDPHRALTTRESYGLVMRNNTARGDQGQMSTPVGEVLRTITTAGHQSLITPGDVEAAAALVDDCLFRMLEPSEVAAGMAFPTDYVWEGTRRERVRMAGNAVTPPAARDLVAAVAEALGDAA